MEEEEKEAEENSGQADAWMVVCPPCGEEIFADSEELAGEAHYLHVLEVHDRPDGGESDGESDGESGSDGSVGTLDGEELIATATVTNLTVEGAATPTSTTANSGEEQPLLDNPNKQE